MVEAPDFDRRMLLLACRLSHESDMKGLLLSVLTCLLDTLNFRENADTVTESMTLIRCIIRLTLKLLGEPGANVYVVGLFLLSGRSPWQTFPCENIARLLQTWFVSMLHNPPYRDTLSQPRDLLRL